MRKFIVLLVAICSMTSLAAQNCMVVNSELVFKSIDEYNQALEELESLGATFQKEVDSRFAAVESLYNSYMLQRNSLSATARSARESQILEAEAEANEYQESIFSTDGVLMQRRLELIAPIQKMVFEAIENYAKENNFELVFDTASNATILYMASSVDRTEAIIENLNR